MTEEGGSKLARLDNIYNYYEILLRSAIEERGIDRQYDRDVLLDICCSAMNKLPAKYIRSEVNLLFFLSDEERVRMTQRVNSALDYALTQLAKRRVPPKKLDHADAK